MAGTLTGIGMALIGVYFTMAGWDRIPTSKNREEHAAWLKKHGLFYKIIGLLMIITGMMRIFIR